MRVWFSNQIWKFKNMPRWKKVVFVLVLVIILVLIFAIWHRYFRQEKIETPSVVTKVEEPIKTIPSTLDGTLVDSSLANRIPLGVMVENHPDARPQAGLDKASIVYEAIAEGGITRFLAIYGPKDASEVGPVRSARTYYVSWAREWKALYAHVGGNIDALDIIKNEKKVYDLDQFSLGTTAYWRKKLNVATEHTMFTDTTKLRAVAATKSYPAEGSFEPNLFKEEQLITSRPEAQSVVVNFSTNTYAVKWTYDKTTNSYLRAMAGTAHKDAVTSEQLSAKNIVIQYVASKATKTRINEQGAIFTVTGEGKAKFIQDGIATECTWKRATEDVRTRFYDSAGNEMKFNAGNTWYEIVHPDLTVTVS